MTFFKPTWQYPAGVKISSPKNHCLDCPTTLRNCREAQEQHSMGRAGQTEQWEDSVGMGTGKQRVENMWASGQMLWQWQATTSLVSSAWASQMVPRSPQEMKGSSSEEIKTKPFTSYLMFALLLPHFPPYSPPVPPSRASQVSKLRPKSTRAISSSFLHTILPRIAS